MLYKDILDIIYEYKKHMDYGNLVNEYEKIISYCDMTFNIKPEDYDYTIYFLLFIFFAIQFKQLNI
jgi:hypothetical protein